MIVITTTCSNNLENKNNISPYKENHHRVNLREKLSLHGDLCIPMDILSAILHYTHEQEIFIPIKYYLSTYFLMTVSLNSIFE